MRSAPISAPSSELVGFVGILLRWMLVALIIFYY